MKTVSGQAEFAALCFAPAFDSTVRLASFPRPGDVLSAASTEEYPGGKGLNAARWLALRGRSTALCGLLGQDDEAAFSEEMHKCGIRDSMIRVNGPVRRNVLFSSPGGDFKVNRPAYPGLEPSPNRVCDAALAAVPSDAPQPRAAIVSGSLPPALPAESHAEAVRTLSARGIAVALDASGEALRHGLAAGPAIVKPNRNEAEGLLGFTIDTPAAFRRALLSLLDSVPLAILSDGAAGCWFAARAASATAPFVKFMPAPHVEAVDPTGAGDTLLAEFLHRRFAPGRPDPLMDEPPSEEAMHFAVASGSAAATTSGALPPCPALADALATDCDVEKRTRTV